jgi:hypothetical protein
MAAARPLKDVFAELTGDDAGRPDAALAAGGHGDLPADLVAEAVVSYADTAPVEVAEHLSPFVMAHSGVPMDDDAAVDGAAEWADLLATAPALEAEFDADEPGADDAGLGGPDTVDGLGGPDTVDGLGGPDTVDGLHAADRRVEDVDFGGGAGVEDIDEPVATGPAPVEPTAPEAGTADAPETPEFDGEVFDSTAPIDLSEVDGLDAGDDVDPAELDG